MPGTPNLIVDQRVHLSYNHLRRAIEESITTGRSHTPTQAQILSEVRTCRPQISSPLHLDAYRAPSATDRARFAGREEVVISIPPDVSITSATASAQSEIRLGPDLIAVALALSDELYLNEVDTAVLLSNARSRAALRPDRDVVAAAKEMAAARRREALLYLQEILRAGLIDSHGQGQQGQRNDNRQGNSIGGGADDSFVSALMRERDILVAEHSVFSNITERMRAAFPIIEAEHQQQQQQTQGIDRRAKLNEGELQLLAETIFLLAYTVQLSKEEAILLRDLITETEHLYTSLLRHERASSRSTRSFAASSIPLDMFAANDQLASPRASEVNSPMLVEAETVRNLMLLAWMCALDRSRYRDLYNPRTGRSDVN